MALFSTHTNLTAVLGLLQDAVDSDDLDGLDERLMMAQLLVSRHRKGHRPGSSGTRQQYEGTVEVGALGPGADPTRIQTEQFNLWLYPGPNVDQVRVELEPR